MYAYRNQLTDNSFSHGEVDLRFCVIVLVKLLTNPHYMIDIPKTVCIPAANGQ